MTALRNLAFIAAITVLPLAIGLLVVGPSPPSGRNTRSATRVGHKALFTVLAELGYRVRRFERGLESPPVEPGVFVALEPGRFLFRDGGKYAGPLLRWVDAGNAALITLGPDPDRQAEVDDRGELFGQTTKQALDAARGVEAAARERRDAATPERAAASGDDRARGDDGTGAWSVSELAATLGVPLQTERIIDVDVNTGCDTSGPMAEALGPGRIHLTRPRVWKVDESVKVLLRMCGAPIVIELERGNGALLLLSEPRIVHNGALSRTAHAALGVKLVERLAAQVDGDVVYFEEFSHGGREVANVLALVTQTRGRWPVGQLILVALIAMVAAGGRRRDPVPFERASRRTRAEVIESMTTLQLGAGDLRGAAERLLQLYRARLARRLALGGEAARRPEAIAAALQLRTGKSASEIAVLLRDAPASAEELVRRAEALRTLTREDEP